MKIMQYFLFTILSVFGAMYPIHAQNYDEPPEYVPNNFDLLYVHDGVSVSTDTIQHAKTQMYDDQKNKTYELEGYASYYAEKFHNRLTANGERFNMNEMTAAHKSLPFDSIVKVTNKANNTSVIVRINDRGPYIENRVIDVSKRAAEELGMIASGLALVNIEIISLGEIEKKKPSGFSSAEKYFKNENDTVSIQVASYSKRTNAQRLINRLYEHEIYAIIEYNNGYYRVIVDKLKKEGYLTISSVLKDLGFTKTIVRADIY